MDKLWLERVGGGENSIYPAEGNKLGMMLLMASVFQLVISGLFFTKSPGFLHFFSRC